MPDGQNEAIWVAARKKICTAPLASQHGKSGEQKAFHQRRPARPAEPDEARIRRSAERCRDDDELDQAREARGGGKPRRFLRERQAKPVSTATRVRISPPLTASGARAVAAKRPRMFRSAAPMEASVTHRTMGKERRV